MLNISTTTAVAWPTPPSGAVAPVSPAAAVQPVQAGNHDGKAQTGFGREGQAARQHALATRGQAEARTAAADSASPAAGEARMPAPHDPVAQRQAKQEATQVAEQQKAKDKQAIEHLQSVLSRMWAASAAVIDRALGIEPPNGSELPGSQSDTAPDLSAVAATLVARKTPLVPERAALPAPDPLPWPVMADAATPEGAEPVAVVELVDPADVLAYDERGNSSMAPLEAGTLVNQMV
ncbi:hypothetical protein [Hydrogenophaga palleronii]|uniref:hypothetical protein n=1 Tax=Hydrogenophaga palleronii TaxID=65655 RepID=UPI000825FD27|nr:hypothetical protein [Hydrogenophaga palleronii]